MSGLIRRSQAANIRRSQAVNLGAVSTLATLFLSGCGLPFGGNDTKDRDYDEYCVDNNSGNRLSDDDCDDDDRHRSTGRSAGGASWYYVPTGTRKPAIGAKGDTGGSYSVPAKGGFGDSGKSSSGSKSSGG